MSGIGVLVLSGYVRLGGLGVVFGGLLVCPVIAVGIDGGGVFGDLGIVSHFGLAFPAAIGT
jgi:hypothetical protein